MYDYIGSLFQTRAYYYILNKALSGEISYAISPLLAFEYEGKIYQKIDEGLLKFSKRKASHFLNSLIAYAQIIWKPERHRPTLSDPGDDKILECAVSAFYNYIITFNKKHFSKNIINPYKLEALTSKEFLQLWRENNEINFYLTFTRGIRKKSRKGS